MASICRRLIKLFSKQHTSYEQHARHADIGLAKKAITAEANRTLREKLERLRKEYPKLSFNALSERLKARESDLFTQAKRIEENDWGVSNGAEVAKGFLSKVQSGDWISVRAEDIRQLAGIEAALR